MLKLEFDLICSNMRLGCWGIMVIVFDEWMLVDMFLMMVFWLLILWVRGL